MSVQEQVALRVSRRLAAPPERVSAEIRDLHTLGWEGCLDSLERALS
jgi:hypothetical protein